MSWIYELKRRRVFQVTAVYAAAAWGITEAIAFLLTEIGAPHWATTLVAILFVLGIPFAAFLAWEFGIGRAGLEHTPATSIKGEAMIVGSLALLVAGTVGLFFLIAGSGPAGSPVNRPTNSVAVLACENVGGNPDFDYYSDGVAEDIINRLSRVASMTVIARQSSFAFKGKMTDVRQIGDELGVAKILTCSVRRLPRTIRVSVQLIDTRTRDHIWSDAYEREMDQFFDVVQDIAVAVANRVSEELLGDEEARLVRHDTQSIEALELYMQGRHHFQQWTVADLKASLDFYQRALEADPGFALAYVGMAEAYVGMQQMEQIPASEVYGLQMAALTRALELNDRTGAAYGMLGDIQGMTEWRWTEARRSLQRALELQPNSALNHIAMGQYLQVTGRHAEAMPYIRRAHEIDPLSTWGWAVLSASYYYIGQYDKALEICIEGLQLDPHYWVAHWMMGWSYMETGDFANALDAFQRAVDNLDDPTEVLPYLASAHAYLGDGEAARQILRRLEKRAQTQWVPPTFFAEIHCSLGENGQCLRYLELAAGAEKDWRLSWYLHPGIWWWTDDVEDMPRFLALRQRIGVAAR